jgi:hypothetical protein
MVSKTEALIITAAVAAAMLPRFEAKVTEFTQQHRSEIQMAVNQIEGRQALPYALPAAPEMPANVELAMNTTPEPPSIAALPSAQIPSVAPMRFEMARVRPAMEAAQRARVQAVSLRPQLAGLSAIANESSAFAIQWRTAAEQNRAAYTVYRLKAKKCPATPTAPAAPVALDEDSGS